jgi:hypothetical protein
MAESANILQVQRFFDVSTSEFKDFWGSLTDEEKEQIKREVAALST